MATPITTCTSEQTLESIHKNFFTAVRAPEKFISTQSKLGASLTKNTKHIFDFVNQQCKDDTFPTCPLDELLTEGFDEEQIWQEIELLNEPTVQHLLQNISNVIARKHKLTFLEEVQKTDQDDRTIGDELMEDGEEDTLENTKGRLEADGSSDEEDDSDTNFDIEDVEEKPSKSRRKVTFRPTRTTPSVVDDTFFKLSDMEQFLEMEDAKEERKRRQEEEGKEESDEDESSDEEGDFDYFEELVSTDDDISDDDDDDDDEVILSSKLSPKKMPSTRDMKYTDFFPAPEEAEEEEQDNLKDEGRKLDREDEEGVLEGGDEKVADGDDDDDEDDNLMEDAQLRNYLAMKAAEESESDGEDADDVLGRAKPDEEKSSFEKRQERLKERIQQLEESNISAKPWQMIGEVAGRKRPDNSLLEERLDFEVGSRPAPVITEETTESIETLIMQRIKDQAWDDVERKIKPKEEAFEFKKRVTLDQEKSKMSLGQIYEQEYLKKAQDNPEEEKEDPAHQEIQKMMDSLFLKLDALSNYHFTPKPAVPELKIVTNVPAISMEEVQPISVTNATLLAPEEVKEKSRSEVKGDTEKTQTDRKRERRQKKKGQKVRAQVRERRERDAEKNKPETKITGSKDAAMEKLEKASRKSSNKTSIVKDDKNMDKKLLTSSKAFFSKLQEEAASEVKSLQKRKKLTDVTVSSKKLKL